MIRRPAEANGLLIDTNILVLFSVGTVNRDRIPLQANQPVHD